MFSFKPRDTPLCSRVMCASKYTTFLKIWWQIFFFFGEPKLPSRVKVTLFCSTALYCFVLVSKYIVFYSTDMTYKWVRWCQYVQTCILCYLCVYVLPSSQCQHFNAATTPWLWLTWGRKNTIHLDVYFEEMLNQVKRNKQRSMIPYNVILHVKYTF